MFLHFIFSSKCINTNSGNQLTWKNKAQWKQVKDARTLGHIILEKTNHNAKSVHAREK